MGLWDKIQSEHKRHQQEQLKQSYTKQLVSWQAQRDATADALNTIKTYNGIDSDEIILKSGELLFYKVTNTGLIEERRGPGHYTGRSQGFSFPIATIGGRSIRYRTGVSKGEFTQGTPRPTQIDNGTTFITNQRLLFEGSSRTRECSFDKIIGLQHNDSEGSTTISVSNRQKPITIFYGTSLAGVFDFRLELALAHYNKTIDKLIDATEEQLSAIDLTKPKDPLQ